MGGGERAEVAVELERVEVEEGARQRQALEQGWGQLWHFLN